MEQNILLSKIGASPTEIGWSQTYSAHYLYLVISLKQQLTDQEVGPLGKELLEKLQREFFALADKKLETIKEAVNNCISIIPEEIEYSIVVATVPSDVLYLVIASSGQVIIKRGENYHIIANGQTGQVKGFSGKLKHTDIVILETKDFAKKITEETIKSIPHVTGVLDLSENLAPQIHNGAEGTEAAIFLQYQNFAYATSQIPLNSSENEPAHSQFPPQEPIPHESNRQSLPPETPYPPLQLPTEEQVHAHTKNKKIPLPSLHRITINKKIILALGILILIGILAFSIQREQSAKNKKQANTALLNILKPAEDKYKEGLEMRSLNEQLALDDFTEAKRMLVEKDADFPKGTDARVAYEKLLSDIQSQLSGYKEGESADQTVFVDSQKEKLSSITAITLKGGAPAITDSNKQAALLKSDGSVNTTYDVDANKLTDVTATNPTIFALGSDGIYQVDKNGSSGKKIVDQTGLSSIDTFGSNLYATDGTTINKYSGESFSKSSYFTGSPKFTSGINDFSIDGAIWVIEKNGTIHKFLKGAEESFKLQGLAAPIGKNPYIYTSDDLKNLYILDATNKRVVVIGKEGSYKASYNLSGLNPTGLAASESAGKIYVVSGGKVYSFEMK